MIQTNREERNKETCRQIDALKKKKALIEEDVRLLEEAKDIREEIRSLKKKQFQNGPIYQILDPLRRSASSIWNNIKKIELKEEPKESIKDSKNGNDNNFNDVIGWR